MARSTRTRPRSNRVDAIRTLDRYTSAPRGARTASRGRPASQVPPGTLPGSQNPIGARPAPGGRGRPAPGARGGPVPAGKRQAGGVPAEPPTMGPQQFPTPFGIPAGVSQVGSPPGTPNLGQAVTKSFQPSVLERTPLVSGGAGIPAQQPGMSFDPAQQGQPQPAKGFM